MKLQKIRLVWIKQPELYNNKLSWLTRQGLQIKQSIQESLKLLAPQQKF
jgi:hypothetical protein